MTANSSNAGEGSVRDMVRQVFLVLVGIVMSLQEDKGRKTERPTRS